MVLGRYGQTIYGMYGTNPEDAGTGTIHACLLGSQEFSLIHQSKCLNSQRSLAVVAALFVSVLGYCDMYNGVLAVKWYWARRYLSVNSGYQYPSRKMAPVQKLLAVILWVLVSR